jgi:hypothetical protein
MSASNSPFGKTKNGVPLKGPVGWLLSRQLVAKLREIALYALYGNKFDHRDWMHSEPLEISPGWNQDEYWFDYISDTGDAQLAMYDVAYLCMSPAWIANPHAPSGEGRVSLTETPQHTFPLPRGNFLFVGGDSAYHVADAGTLAQRFQTPFNWAYDDIFGATKDPAPETRRPIIAIPANHDYYDSLDGFSRQFRKTLEPEPYNTNLREGPQLCLKGFYRVQTASYVALKLPYGWWLWGLDSQNGKIDQRQAEFFKRRGTEQADTVPAKLIVATPEPSTVFGCWMTEDHEMVSTFNKLGLIPAFLEQHDGDLPPDRCRLDISGDVHHYARHWGQGNEDETGQSRPNYASVVAGGGGAFLHPTYTMVRYSDRKQVSVNRLYPAPLDSFRLAARNLLSPWVIARGGLVWLAGALVAMFAYFAVTIPDSTWALFSNHDHAWLRVLDDGLRPKAETTDTLLSRIRSALEDRGSPNLAGLIILLVSSGRYALEALYVGFLALFFWKWVRPGQGRLREKLSASVDEWRKELLRFMAPCIPAGVPLFLLVLFRPEFGQVSSLLNSLFVLAYLAVAGISFQTSLWYSNLMVDRAVRVDENGRVYAVSIAEVIPQWSFVIFAIVSVAYGLWSFGNAKLSVMVNEAFFVLLTASLIGGLYLLAASVGAQLQTNQAGRRLFGGMGHWHWILQLLVPLLLTLYGTWWSILLTLVALAAANYLLNRYVQALTTRDLDERRDEVARKILRAWLGIGTIALLIGLGSRLIGGAEEVTSLRLFLLAPALGALFGCAWLGWYLVAAALFNGHNNEAGGGSLSANYRHLVRIRLTPETLTAYVIGIDTPMDLAQVAPDERRFRLVDVFTIRRGAA